MYDRSSMYPNLYFLDGTFDKAIEKGLIYCKSLISFSEVDTRALFWCLAWNLPHFYKQIRIYEVIDLKMLTILLEQYAAWRGKER